MSKIVVGMSGGVDSAVVAHLLKKAGHKVIGIFMRNWDSLINNDELGNPRANDVVCPEEEDWKDVQKIGHLLNIEVQRVDFVKEYWDSVFTDLVNQYKKGRTPNPDVLCNKHIKFGAFHKWVSQNIPDYDFIATGHYAKVQDQKLLTAKDVLKDQTYFLAQLSAKQLTKVMFPLGNYTKEEVRQIARKNVPVVANKKDSMGICFIGPRDFSQFLQNYIPAQPGDIIDITNKKVIGTHQGAMYYTIGQRRGLKLGGMPEAYYVAGHDLSKKIVYAAPHSRSEYLHSDKAHITGVNWIVEGYVPKDLRVKLRYNSPAIKASMSWKNKTTIVVNFPDGFLSAALGQQAVFYDQNYCLGGGVIDKLFSKGKEKQYL